MLIVGASSSVAQLHAEPVAAADLTGNWFSPQRDGEGCNLTLEGDAQSMILTCYTYLNGKQVWLIGTATLDDALGELTVESFVRTSGAQFGSAFRPEDVVREVWGRASMRFADCNSGLIRFEPADSRFSSFEAAYEKIVPGTCNASRLDTAVGDVTVIGNWFDPQRDGEGIQVALEADGATYVATYYTYLGGEQAWVIGTGHLDGTQIAFNDMTLTSGTSFGQDFDPADVVRTPWGRMLLDIGDCSQAQVSFDSDLPQFEDFSTTMVKIVAGPCRAITLQGQVMAGEPIASAQVIASIGDRTYETAADAVGKYRLRIVTRKPDEFVRLRASGSDAQPQVRLESLVGNAGRLIAEAGTDAVLSDDENAQTDVTHFSTALFALMREANAGVIPDNDGALDTLTQGFFSGYLLRVAAAIRLVIEGSGELPVGTSDTLALVTDPAAMQAFTGSLPDGVFDQAVDTVAGSAPVSVAFATGSLPDEYALYYASTLGTVKGVDGGAAGFLSLTSNADTTGLVDWFPEQPMADIGGGWSLVDGVLEILLNTPRQVPSFSVDCETPSGEILQVAFVEDIKQIELRRIAHGKVDIVELRMYHEPRLDELPGCTIPFPPVPYPEPYWSRSTLLAFASSPLPFSPDDLAGARTLPIPNDPDAGGFGTDALFRYVSGLFAFDGATLDAPGMAADFEARLFDGHIQADIARADASASYTVEFRRYRNDGRKGDAVMALVTRSDGARAVAGGLSVAAVPGMAFDVANAPGIYRSGIELGDFPGTFQGDQPFFIQIRDDAGQTATRTLFDPEFGPFTTQRVWSIEDGQLALSRPPGGSLGGLRDRDWMPLAIDGNRVYVRERIWTPDANAPQGVALIEHRSNSYDLVDTIQVERP